MKSVLLRMSGVVLLAVAFTACSKSSSSPTGPGTGGNVSFSSQVQPIFTANCALSGCHAGSSPQRGMNLSSGQAYSSIVNVPSVEVSGFKRVDPSNADSSYLYLKITAGAGITGAQMPYLRAPLSASDIQTIKDWINQGAENN